MSQEAPLNAIPADAGIEDPEFNHREDRKYLLLEPDDYQEHGVDMAGNVALLVNEENAREVKRLAEKAIEELEKDPLDMEDRIVWKYKREGVWWWTTDPEIAYQDATGYPSWEVEDMDAGDELGADSDGASEIRALYPTQKEDNDADST